jgi:hypothetical protein
MDSELIDKKLKKINTIYNEFKAEGNITTLEKDLLLSYIRELYDLVKYDGASQTQFAIAPNELRDDLSDKLQKQENKVEEPAIESVEPKVLDIVDNLDQKNSEPVESDTGVITNQIKEEVVVSEPIAEERKIQISDQTQKLFVIEKAKDLSERLAMSPINDISKSMSINDRALVSKYLFGNDIKLFSETLNTLNNLHLFDEAKEILMPIAQKNVWTDEEHREKAEGFIKLVYRRYSN